MALLRSIAFALVFYTGSLLYVIAASLVMPVSKRGFRRIANSWARFHYICARLLLGIRTRIEGDLGHGPALYAIKHESMFETIDSARLLRNPVLVAKKELLEIPFWGRLARAYGILAIDRSGGAKALRRMMAETSDAVARGRPIVIFPEGTRVPHGRRVRLQSGFAGLYRILGLPVVPIAVDSGRVSPRNAFLKRSGTVTYKAGEPIAPGLDRKEIERRVHEAINALNAPAAEPQKVEDESAA